MAHASDDTAVLAPPPFTEVLLHSFSPFALRMQFSDSCPKFSSANFAFASFPYLFSFPEEKRRNEGKDYDDDDDVLVVCHTSYACFFLRRLRHLSPACFLLPSLCSVLLSVFSMFFSKSRFAFFRGYFPEYKIQVRLSWHFISFSFCFLFFGQVFLGVDSWNLHSSILTFSLLILAISRSYTISYWLMP